jgi:hypothetical protein
MAFKLYIITAMLWLVLTRRNSVGYIIDLRTYPFSEKKCYAMFTINKKKKKTGNTYNSGVEGRCLIRRC